jgi:predicted XRE-type DNA-binding protein
MSKEAVRYLVKAGSECSEMVYASDYDALLAERDRLKEALAAMLEIHGVTQRFADTHIEIPQSWVDVSDFARAALSGESNAA